MTVRKFIEELQTLPLEAQVFCGETPFTMYVVSDRDGVVFLDSMFIGHKGVSPAQIRVGENTGMKTAEALREV